MERVFKLAGKTHYSNASFLVGTGLSALAFTSKLSREYLKTHVSQGR